MPTANDLRPQYLDEMIGNEKVRRKARIAVASAMHRGEPLGHCLLTSTGGGLGKSTMASCLANEMYAPLVSTSGQCINTATDLRNILVRLKPGTMLLIDEAHCLGRMAAEELLLVLEEGVLNVNLKKGGTPVRIRVPPFTLILATTQPAALSAPLIQRFGLHFRFGFYSADELRTIISNATKRMDVEFDGGVCIELARRARGVPRIALRLTDRVRLVVLCVDPQVAVSNSSLNGATTTHQKPHRRAHVPCA
jgi:holliday junction DNA helicase RuvB